MVKFNSISLVITDKDAESAAVKVKFDPPLEENVTEEEFEKNLQPCTVLAFMLLRELEKVFEGESTQVSEPPHTLQ